MKDKPGDLLLEVWWFEFGTRLKNILCTKIGIIAYR